MKVAALALGLGLWAGAASAAGPVLSEKEGYALLAAITGSEETARQRAARRLGAARDRRWVAPTVDALFFVPKAGRGPVFRALAQLAGEDRGNRYLDWIELVGAREEWSRPEGYDAWKAETLGRIDPRFERILKSGPSRIRLEEVVFGGVPVEGIPALDRPRAVEAAAATFLDDEEMVFGVRVGEAARAYPVRVLSWHEMTNDTLDGVPVSLAYCTLCGSGLAWDGRVASGQSLTFGTSGLLYRSNKLMLDRETGTLWNQLTGEAVVGRLAAGERARLRPLPTTVTRWREWRTRNPQTSALEPDPTVARRFGFDYAPGAADRARAGVNFPVWLKNTRLDGREEVVGVRSGAAAKAFVLAELVAAGVVNEQVGDLTVVLVSALDGGAVRVFERRDLRLSREAATDALFDQSNRRWRITEQALVCEGEGGAVDTAVAPLPRVASSESFWFAWFGFFPHTELWRAPRVLP